MRIVLDEGARMPTRAHPEDAGLDIYASENMIVPPHHYANVCTGVHVEIPKGCVGLLTSKSGLMSKRGITTRGTIDSGYTGAIKVTVFNGGCEWFEIHKGEKISQLVILPVLFPELKLAEDLGCTARGDHGFGSSGK